MSEKALINYFSGVGSSEFLAQKTKNILEKYSYTSEFFNIENENPLNHNEYALVGFVFPVYGFGLPAKVVEFFKKLPEGGGKKTFIFAVCGGMEGIAILQALFLLWLKGYKVVNANKLRMPDTWGLVVNAPTREGLEKRSQEAIEEISKNIELINNEKKSISIANPISLILLGVIYISFYFFGRFFCAKCFTASDKCNSCGICAQMCPSGTIKLKNNKPFWNWSCTQCFRCFHICPQNAIEISTVLTVYSIAGIFLGLYLFDYLFQGIIIPYESWIKTVFVVAFSFISMDLMYRLNFLKLIPSFYLTKNRKRYKYLIPK